jgi:hypothetical protein
MQGTWPLRIPHLALAEGWRDGLAHSLPVAISVACQDAHAAQELRMPTLISYFCKYHMQRGIELMLYKI